MSAKLLAKNIISQSVLQVANLVLPFITIPYITKIIGPDKFGVINYAAAVVAYFTLLINFSFDMTASRAIAQDSDNQVLVNKTFSETLFTKIFLFAVCACCFLIVLIYLPAIKSEKLVAVYSFLIVVGWVITPNWLFQGKQHLNKVAMFNLVAKLLFTLSIFVFIHKKQQYVLQPLILSVSQIIVGAASFAYALRKYNISIIKIAMSGIMAVLKQGKEIFFSMLTISLYSNTTIIILGLFLTSTDVGYYSAAYRLIITAVTILAIPLNQALFPFISSAFGENFNKGINELQKIFPICLIFSFSYSAIFFISAPLIIHLFYGQAFNESIPIFRAMSAIPFLVNLNSFLGIQALINLKKDKLFLNITLISSVVGVAATFLLGYYFGIKGGALSWLIAEIFNCLLFYIAVKRLDINLINPQYFSVAYFRSLGAKVYNNISAKLAGREN